MLRRFEVHRATSVAEAIALRTKYGDDAAVYAGGTELLLAMKLGVARRTAAYVKFQILERPSAGVAIAAELQGGRFVGAPVVVVGAVDEMPRMVETSSLAGATARDAATADALASAARASVEPVADLAGGADYKRHIVGVFARRALDALVAEAA